MRYSGLAEEGLKRTIWILCMAATLLAGCGGGGGGGTGVFVTNLRISIPNNTIIVKNATVRLTALATYTDGTQAYVTPAWTATIGSVASNGTFSTGALAAAGFVSGTYGGAIATATVTVVTPGSLSGYAVTGPDNATPSAMAVGSKAVFYVTAQDAGQGGASVIVPADAGTWGVTGGIGTIDTNTGQFTATVSGSGTIAAKANGTAATPLGVSVIGSPISVHGLVYVSSLAGGVSNVNVTFLDAGGNPVGQLATDSNGVFTGKISPSAVSMYIPSISFSYYNVCRYKSVYYWIGTPVTNPCRLPLPSLYNGIDVGTIFVFYVGGDPPPPPPGC